MTDGQKSIALAVSAKGGKIKHGSWWHVSAIVPEVEKLFESPQERSLRRRRQAEESRLERLRGGTITAAVGLGLIPLFVILSFWAPLFLPFIGPSLLVFLIGLGLVVNGLYFTIPKDLKAAEPTEDRPELNLRGESKKPSLPEPSPFPNLSVVENTTRNLVETDKRDTNKIKPKRFYDE